MLKVALRKRCADQALREDVVRESGVGWTIIRPLQLIDKPLSGMMLMTIHVIFIKTFVTPHDTPALTLVATVAK